MSQKKQARPARPDVFIDQDHDAFKDCELKQIEAHFEGNPADQAAQVKLYHAIVSPRLDNLTVKAVFESAYDLAQGINSRVCGIQECNIKFTKGNEGLDTADMYLKLSKAPAYFFYPFVGYYQNPNQVHYGFKIADYRTTIGGLLKPFKSTSVGYKWNYGKN